MQQQQIKIATITNIVETGIPTANQVPGSTGVDIFVTYSAEETMSKYKVTNWQHGLWSYY